MTMSEIVPCGVRGSSFLKIKNGTSSSTYGVSLVMTTISPIITIPHFHGSAEETISVLVIMILYLFRNSYF
jgi:hypothetical protein